MKRRRGHGRQSPPTAFLEACTHLALTNIPFRFIIAGDDWVSDRLLTANLSQYQAVITVDPSHLSPRQEAKLQFVEDKLITWPDSTKLAELVPPQIIFTGADNIAAVPRYKPNDSEAPVVCHLVNKNYQTE